ncbi:MAG: ribose-phosphate diphosphokinase [Candidatus Heimdallarchaeaceae archaeon]
MKILLGPNSDSLGEYLSKRLDLQFVNFNFKQFYDGETYLQIDDQVINEDILIIQSTYPDQEKSLLETMFIASTLKELGADRVLTIIPYLCYARADKRKLKGESLSHHLTLSYLQNSGVDSILTVNVHNKEQYLIQDSGLDKQNLNVLPFMVGEFLKGKDKSEWIIVGPDKGSEDDIIQIADEFSISYYIMEKSRDPITHIIQTKKPSFNFSDKNVLVIDDVVSSGTTAKTACSLIFEKGAKSISILFVHVLSKPEVIADLKKLGNLMVYSSNTITQDNVEQIDISPILSKFVEDKYL